MAWRGVVITEAARLKLAQGCLLVSRDDGEIRLAFEDISYLILDSPQVSLSSALLAALSANNVLTVATDAKHLPNGALLPLQGHFRQTQSLRQQLALKPGLKNRLWQRLVRAKIANQGQTLILLDRPGGRRLLLMAERVAPGDKGRLEGQAARDYFSELFEDFVRRREGDVRNALMNYAYALVRAALARGLAAQGLHPAIGLFHDNVDNAFNLADDLIEPWRPIVDRHVANWIEAREDDDELTVDDRREMARVLVSEVALDGQSFAVIAAIESCIDGLMLAMAGHDPDLMPVPAHLDA